MGNSSFMNEEEHDGGCCDAYYFGYNQGYRQGYENGVEDANDFEEDYPEEIFIDAAPFNIIEGIKDDMRAVIGKLHAGNDGGEVINHCWAIFNRLITLEKEIAGDAVITQYLRDS